jgi:hypothetical protein
VARPERLEGRDGQIWRAYILGATQERIAGEHGVSRQRVGQILGEVRASIPAEARSDAALLDLERLDLLLSGVMPAAVAGDTGATRAALAVLERRARMLRLDLDEPLKISFERHLDDQGELLADTIGAVLDALDLSQDQRLFALATAQASLAGGPLPEPAPAAPVVAEEPKRDLMDDFRKFAEREGFDPGDLDDDQEDGDDGTG